MNISHLPPRWKRLFQGEAIPGWILLGWRLIEIIHTLTFVNDHVRSVWLFATSATGNLLVIFCGLAWLFAVVFWPKKDIPQVKAHAGEIQEKQKPEPPDTTVKDSDPQLEIKIADLRGKTGSTKPEEQACFDLINRGKHSPAKFVCIEDFNIGGYSVAFRSFPRPIPPFANHESIFPLYINKPDGTQCTNTIFTVFSWAWSDLHNSKLYEYSIPLKATYQDDFRNLFEVRCDLVFYPLAEADHISGKGGNTVIETKNHRIRKVSPVSLPINWDGPMVIFS